MNKRLVFGVGVLGVFAWSVCTTAIAEMKPPSTAAEASAPAPMDTVAATTITLEQALHFVGPGETDVLVPVGEYQVQKGEASQLQLIGKEKPIMLNAFALSHDENIDVPMARIVAGEEDTQQVFLLTPDGTGLAAAGSESGVGSRGFASMLGGIKTLNAPAPIQEIYAPAGGWIKKSNGAIPRAAFPAGRNNFGSVYICRGSFPSYPGSIWVGGIWPGSNGCRTVNGLIANYEVLAPFWGHAKNGALPPGAQGVGGNTATGPLYTCRTYYDGGWLAGRLRPGTSGCEIAWKGRAIMVQGGYDVLLKSFVTTTGTGNDQTLSTETIQRAMPLGRPGPDSRTGAPCVTRVDGITVPGRLSVADQGCAIAWNGTQVNQRNFSTFVGFWRGGVDNTSLIAGKHANSSKPQLYACMRMSAGSNETAVGWFGDPVQTCEFIYPDGKTAGRDRLDQVKILGDWYQDLVPNWDPAVK